MSNSVVAAEVARFDALAARWWDPRGPMAPLHAMNALRVGWVDREVRDVWKRPVRLLDVGCGGGLAAEALARLGHDVTGIDAAAEVIDAARAHAVQSGLPMQLSYQTTTAERLVEDGARFEAVTALEVVEHVADPAAFAASLSRLLLPGGVLVMSTLNRTRRSYITAKLGAEYVLRLLPIGTHAWKQFISPPELSAHLRTAGLRTTNLAGMGFNPWTGAWRQTRDLSVNYILAARKDPKPA